MNRRERLAAQLEAWSQPGGVLDFKGPNSSQQLFRYDPRRDLVLEEVLDEYLDLQHDIGHDGQCAVVTAGPPGSGKSTLVRGLGGGFRLVDADVIKDLLIRRALADGTYEALLSTPIADREWMQPRELSGVLHHESTVIANDVLATATSRRENVVMEGTLSWPPLVEDLIETFRSNDYRQLTILSCDVPEPVAQQRALDRWWRDREGSADGLGGRYVPRRVISDLYPKTVDSSVCRENAEEMFARSRGAFEQVELQTVDATGTNTSRHKSR